MNLHSEFSKLLTVASRPISSPVRSEVAIQSLGRWGLLGRELASMLSLRNGFYAYESALLVRPLQASGCPLGLLEWNASNLWKSEFVEDLSEVLCFAEDVFGVQFCIRGDSVWTFDPETGLFEEVSTSLGTWANIMVDEFAFRTGYPLAHAWQIVNGPLTPGMRLLPKTLFVCGGKYELENFYPLGETEGMRFRLSIANQIRDLPDGTQIVFRFSPPAS